MRSFTDVVREIGWALWQSARATVAPKPAPRPRVALSTNVRALSHPDLHGDARRDAIRVAQLAHLDRWAEASGAPARVPLVEIKIEGRA